MTDIVERLRVEAKDWEGNDCTYHDLFTQAADEIERLRARVASLKVIEVEALALAQAIVAADAITTTTTTEDPFPEEGCCGCINKAQCWGGSPDKACRFYAPGGDQEAEDRNERERVMEAALKKIAGHSDWSHYTVDSPACAMASVVIAEMQSIASRALLASVVEEDEPKA